MKNSLLLLAAILFCSVGYSQKLNVEGDARIQGAFNLKDANNSIRLGDGAGASTTQDSSVLIGELAGAFHAGMNNVFLGIKSGVGTSLFNQNSGNNNTFLGTYTGMSQSLFSTGITNAVALGFRAKVGCSNCASIGGTGDYALKVGIGTETPTTFLDVQGNPDSTNDLINARVNYTGSTDIIAVQGNSRPSAGYGVGIKGIGGFNAVQGIATMFNSQLSETTITTAGGHFTNDMRGTGNKYGVYGRVLQSGTTNLRAGVYGEAPNEVNSWAGYFNGKIYAANNVGIGTETPSTLLDVQGNPNSTNDLINARVNYTGNSDIIAVQGGSITAPGWGVGLEGTGGYIGVRGYAEHPTDPTTSIETYGGYFENHITSGSGDKYGVYGYVDATPSTYNSYGIYGEAETGSNSWAGYFDGNVGYTGTLSMVSDRRLKKDITDLEDALAKVMALEPKTYSFRQDEYPHLNLAQGQQIGFISQDVEAILPELTHDYMASTPNQDNPKQSSKTPVKGMDYISMIPVLTGAIQEQQEIIEEKEARILTLEQQLADMNDLLTRLVDHVDLPQEPVEENITLTDAELGQNQPNPSTEQTAIPFRIPEHVGQAIIRITSTNGQVIYESEIGHRGPGLWKVNTKNLSPATYQYSLILDGQIIGTRRMVIQK